MGSEQLIMKLVKRLEHAGAVKESLTKEKELVRLFTCGSVDDGKSTLIGRLFIDTDQVASDTLEELETDSASQGTNNGELDPALLTDGLKAEREQGITIDVAYRFFSTDRRTFIIADTPGHEQYTRNMVTGASTADMAIILVDAQRRVTEQSRRHTAIASLLGIKHVLVAVNKMDLVAFSQEVFESIRREYTEFASRLNITDLHFIPVCALHGDNVVTTGKRMPWYGGGTLLHLLNSIHIVSDRNHIDFRFPVQYVNRPSSDYRGYCGTVASGGVRPGDEVVVLPKHTKAKVKSIDAFEGSLSQAVVPMPVTLTFEGNIDVSRGDMITPVNNVAQVGTEFDAMIVWMDEEAMEVGHEYVLRQATKSALAAVETVRYVLEINELHRKEGRALEMNEIGRCAITTNEPVAFDSYERNRSTGAFILIDRISNHTVAAGMILDRKRDTEVEDVEKTSTVAEVKKLPILWLTGNTGSGKTTVAHGVEKHFNQEVSLKHPFAKKVIVLDGDEMRETISDEEDLSKEGRWKHNLRVARLAKLLQDKGFLVIVSVIAPFEKLREEVSAICDPTWIYVKRRGLESEEQPYEEPRSPDLILDHDERNATETVKRVVEFLLE